MPCSCQSKRQTFEVVPNAGTAARPTFTSSNRSTAVAAADRYPTAVVRDKTTDEAIYFAWPKGSYEVVLQGGDGEVVQRTTVSRASDRSVLRAAADAHAGNGAVVRQTGTATVVYPLTAALTASASPLKASAAPVTA